jgi:branched-chain amino acid transport system ATP-binding protein
LLDEPTLGLAPSVRGELSSAIEKAFGSGVAIVLVEQDFEFLSRLVDRFYMVEEGRVVFEGRADELSESRIMEMYFGDAARAAVAAKALQASVDQGSGEME